MFDKLRNYCIDNGIKLLCNFQDGEACYYNFQTLRFCIYESIKKIIKI